ncbi:TetR/AcrR family transcriptional regulator [Nakamurella deserti]|uniref:TetR/AcrR family transcriptional regulator n=1 Tax=Nakamurella deserti TaxID=2164074 RepID=UPI000DBE2E74|nr:TetR/AcrR family transcriptional regulator [Nakamurella deserti]
MTDPDVPARERILRAVLDLLREGGADAVSTRAVTARAGVQAPAIYRQFGDKDGLLDAAAERALTDWVAHKSTGAAPSDPVEALRSGWDDAVQFGLDQPDAYRIAYARTDRGPAVRWGHDLLREKILAVARAGRLAVPAGRAQSLMQATNRGVVLTLLDTPVADRDPGLSALARESTLTAITTDAPSRDASPAAAATALQALLPESTALVPAERQLLHVWLERIATDAAP